MYVGTYGSDTAVAAVAAVAVVAAVAAVTEEESVDVVDCIVIDCISKPVVCSRGFLAVKFLINRQKRSKRSKKCCVRKRKRKRKIKLDNNFFSLC